MKDCRADQRHPQLVLRVYKPMENYSDSFSFRSYLLAYKTESNCSGKIYRSRAELRGANEVFISTKDAANGKAPRYDYQEVLSAKIKKQADSFDFLLEKPEQSTALSKIQIRDLKKLPFVCLSDKFRTSRRQIKMDDIIRLGSAFLKVIYIGNVPNQKAEIRASEAIDRGEKYECRICLDDENSEEFIRPCDCSGSQQNVHFCCLRDWFNHKAENLLISDKQRGVVRYDTEKLECQVCKRHLSNSYKINNQPMSLISFDRSDGNPYIVLETMTFDKRKTVFKVTPKSQKIKIGSSQSSDVVLLPNFREFVEPVHAEISLQDNKFYIQDKGSQSGTLILMQDQLKIEKQTCVMINNRVYHIDTQKGPK